jgi:hypothetical protein
MFGFMGQVSAAILHLGDPRIGIIRILPVLVGPPMRAWLRERGGASGPLFVSSNLVDRQ